MKLTDSVLHMITVEKSSQKSHRVFCGLSDGTLNILEVIFKKNFFYKINYKKILFKLTSSDQPVDNFALNISKSPISYLELVKKGSTNHIWLASANMIFVLNEQTLLNEKKFEISVNQFDHILMLNSSSHGVWLSIRGSSIIHLYDKTKFNCKLLFDIRTNQKLNSEKDDDFSFNFSRLTSILSLGNLVWLGTGDGYVFIYSIFTKIKAKSRSESVALPNKHFSKTNPLIKKQVAFVKSTLSLNQFRTSYDYCNQETALDLVKSYLRSLPNNNSMEKELDEYLTDDLWSGSSRLSYSSKQRQSSLSSQSLGEESFKKRPIKSKRNSFCFKKYSSDSESSSESESTVILSRKKAMSQNLVDKLKLPSSYF